MEMTKMEIAAVEQIARESEQQVRELTEVQLALIGGGIGEVIVA